MTGSCDSSGGSDGCCGSEKHHQSTNCCQQPPQEKCNDDNCSGTEDCLICLALLKDNGTEISLFDAKGEVRSFSFKGDIRKLCFSTHHGYDADDLMTPCFDEDGLHGEPEEGCFCGSEGPHIHAHYHNPATCNDDDHCGSTKSSDLESALASLAPLTLFPIPVKVEESSTGITTPKKLFEIPESEFMPSCCNSSEYSRHMSGTESDERPPEKMKTKMLHKIQHDDHFDYLVHNKTTGDLHLEHPCDDCGETDFHGKFRLIAKRKWNSGMENVNLHFFETSRREFSLRHLFEPETGRVSALRDSLRMPSCCLEGICEPDGISCCVDEEFSINRKKKQSLCSGSTSEGSCCPDETSRSGCRKKSCCSSDQKSTPADDCCCAEGSCSLGDKPDVDRCGVKTKSESGCCSGSSCCSPPDEKSKCCVGDTTSSCCAGKTEKPKCCATDTSGNYFVGESCSETKGKLDSCCAGESCCDSTVMDVREEGTNPDSGGVGTKIIVRSSLECTQICCSSEVPAVEKILKPLPGIEKVMVNPTLRRVTIDHNISLVAVSDVEKVLNENHFGATVLEDGGRSQQKKNGSGKSRFYASGICCASEIPTVRQIVEPLDGVSSVAINVAMKTVYVEHDLEIISADDICNALNGENFGAIVEHDASKEIKAADSFASSIFTITAGVCDHPTKVKLTGFLQTFGSKEVETFSVQTGRATISVVHNPLLLSADDIAIALAEKTQVEVQIEKDGKESMLWEFPEVSAADEVIQKEIAKLRPTVVLSGVFWIVSMFSYIGGNWEYLKYVGLVSIAFGLPPIALKAWSTLRRFQFDTNCLMLFAVIGAMALQEFPEAAAVTFLFSLSEWLEVKATTRARNALSAIVQLRPATANLIHPQSEEIVLIPASAVPVGALVSVRTGDKVPCDGVVVEGQSTVDESSLTGESRPVKKLVNDAVSGGTINCGNTQLVVRTTASADDSAVARLIRLVEEAQANRSETEKLVDAFARIYTPIVVLSALLMCTIPWAFGRETGREWTNNGLVLIVVACPCALIISTPVSYVAGLATTAQKGILIKGGAYLEALGLTKRICFDKTGTLTLGRFQLLQLTVIGGKKSRSEVLEVLSVVEERASHPLAQALVDAARQEGVNPPKGMYVKDLMVLAGEGVSGVVNEMVVHVGNRRLFDRLGLYAGLPTSEKDKALKWEEEGGTVGFMSIASSGIVCSYCVADAVRPEARDVLEQFASMGINCTMLTGDNNDAAQAIGKQIGLESHSIKSQLLPEEKVELVTEIKAGKEGRKTTLGSLCSTKEVVLMCGDGVNDAPALANADVGVAMGEGAALAMETADVTLLESHLEKLVYSVKMGRRVIRKIKENVVFSVAVKMIVLGFALAGRASLWGAIVSDVGAMLLVTLNGMRLLPSKRSRRNETELIDRPRDIEKGESSGIQKE